MADERGVAAALGEPLLLKRQAAQHVIDQAAASSSPATRPGPNLRRHVIENRNAVGLRPAGDPPVEARIVDQHDGVRAGDGGNSDRPGWPGRETCAGSAAPARNHITARAVRSACKSAAGRGHLRAAVADALEIGRRARSWRIRLAPCRSPLGSPAEKKIFMRALPAGDLRLKPRAAAPWRNPRCARLRTRRRAALGRRDRVVGPGDSQRRLFRTEGGVVQPRRARGPNRHASGGTSTRRPKGQAGWAGRQESAGPPRCPPPPRLPHKCRRRETRCATSQGK